MGLLWFSWCLMSYILHLEASPLVYILVNQTNFRLKWADPTLDSSKTPESIILYEKTEKDKETQIGMVEFNGSYTIGNTQSTDLCKRHTFTVTLLFQDGEKKNLEYVYSPPDITEVSYFDVLFHLCIMTTSNLNIVCFVFFIFHQ